MIISPVKQTEILMKKAFATVSMLFLLNVGNAQTFKVSFNRSVNDAPFTGKVYVYLSKNDKEPIKAEDWIIMNPVVSADIRKLKPGEYFIVNDNTCKAYPVAPTNMERGDYYAQVVFDNGETGRTPLLSPGNFYSAPQKITFSHNLSQIFTFVADKRIADKIFENTAYTKKIELQSPLLSAFHKKPVTINAVLRLPKEYTEQPSNKFPLRVSIGGFGGDINNASGNNKPANKSMDSLPFVELRLDGNCKTGHNAYANSDNNGPWGDALVYELIPYIEKEYRLNGFRFVTGHSSGGWSSLWLQSHYPASFHGCWSSSPDAIDFRNFEGVNLYTAKNVFYDSTGKLLAGMTVGGWAKINYKKDVCGWENIIRGEQYTSFNAVFGGRKKDGGIDYLWDFTSGDINTSVIENWKRYDISYYITSSWSTLEKDLAGKILITTGSADNWSLEKAVYLLQKDAATNKMDIAFSIFPGDHFIGFTRELDSIGSAHTIKCYKKWKASKDANGKQEIDNSSKMQ